MLILANVHTWPAKEGVVFTLHCYSFLVRQRTLQILMNNDSTLIIWGTLNATKRLLDCDYVATKNGLFEESLEVEW